MVCAEPLEWIAYASCGHKEACSRCVARLRFVLKDKRCVICQQQSPAVVVTRNVGTFTSLLPAEAFGRLQVSGDAGTSIHLWCSLRLRQLLGCRSTCSEESCTPCLRRRRTWRTRITWRSSGRLTQICHLHSACRQCLRLGQMCRSLCSYTHPALGGTQANFTSLQNLAQHIQKTQQLSFCSICLEGRKVHPAWLAAPVTE